MIRTHTPLSPIPRHFLNKSCEPSQNREAHFLPPRPLPPALWPCSRAQNTHLGAQACPELLLGWPALLLDSQVSKAPEMPGDAVRLRLEQNWAGESLPWLGPVDPTWMPQSLSVHTAQGLRGSERTLGNLPGGRVLSISPSRNIKGMFCLFLFRGASGLLSEARNLETHHACLLSSVGRVLRPPRR